MFAGLVFRPGAAPFLPLLLIFVHITDGDRKTAPRRRGQRREAILEAAADLFSERGYRGTGIDEIGEAAGVTGPGVYRHFDNKNDLLGEVVKRAITRVVEGVAEVVSENDESWPVLEGLLDNMISAVLSDRAAWAVVVREQRHLERGPARALNRAHRLHVDEWTHALAEVRPDLSDSEARVVIHGVLGLTAPFAARFESGVDDAQLAAILREMGLRVLRGATVAV